LIDQLQQNPHADVQYHGLLMSNMSPTVIEGGGFTLEISKSGWAPWNADKSEFICTDQYSLDECFNTNVSFKRSFFDNGVLTSIHSTSLLIPAWLSLIVHSHVPPKRGYFKYHNAVESIELSDMWTRYGFVFHFMFSESGEADLFERGKRFLLVIDHNLQGLGYRINGTFNVTSRDSIFVSL
jgi:hypothetical protein